MASESEHRLEPVLRAWAQKRRAEHREEFELHPATRRLLLGEVSRRFPKREEARPPWRFTIGRLWGSTVSALGLLVILGVAAWAFKHAWTNLDRLGDIAVDDARPPRQIAFSLRNRSVDKDEKSAATPLKADKDLSQVVSQAEEKPAAAAATKRELQQALQRGAVAPVERDRLAEAKAPAPARANGRRAEPAPSQPAPAGGRSGDSAAAPKSEIFKTTLSPALETGGVAVLAMNLTKADQPLPSINQPVGAVSRSVVVSAPAAPPAAAPAALAPAAAGEKAPLPQQQEVALRVALADSIAGPTSPASAARLSYGGPADGGRAADAFGGGLGGAARDDAAKSMKVAGRSLPSLISPPVLKRFELSQHGIHLALVDLDGSVYDGAVASLADDKSALARLGRTVGEERQRSQADAVLAKRAVSAEGTGTEAPVLFFRVSGTNRTLNQPVVLTGTISGLAGLADASKSKVVMEAERTVSFGKEAIAAPATTAPAGAGLAAGRSYQMAPAGQRELSLGESAGTNTVVLQGRLRLGTNAERPLRALRVP
jgi:hypothetical protein